MNLPASSATPWLVGPWDTTWLAWNLLTCQDCPGFLVIYTYMWKTQGNIWDGLSLQVALLCACHEHIVKCQRGSSTAWWDCACMLSCFSRIWLCNPMDCGPPGSSVRGILQARILERVAVSSSRGSSQPRDRTCVSCISCTGRRILYPWITREVLYNNRLLSLFPLAQK